MQPISMMRWPAAASRPVVSVSSTTCRMAPILEELGAEDLAGRDSARGELVDAAVRERIDALVAGVARVALHPMPFEDVVLHERVERLPQILILHRLAVGGLPAARFPVRHPLED